MSASGPSGPLVLKVVVLDRFYCNLKKNGKSYQMTTKTLKITQNAKSNESVKDTCIIVIVQ